MLMWGWLYLYATSYHMNVHCRMLDYMCVRYINSRIEDPLRLYWGHVCIF